MMSYKNILLATLTTSTLVVGCATNPAKTDIIVSPATSSYRTNTFGADYNHTNGALVSNSVDITKAAATLVSVVYFDYNSSVINQVGKNTLNKQVAFLKQNPTARVLVTGHTDERGSREYNRALGERRARAVAKYLTSQGIDTTNIKIRSLSEEMPAVTGKTEKAYQKNRRVVLSY